MERWSRRRSCARNIVNGDRSCVDNGIRLGCIPVRVERLLLLQYHLLALGSDKLRVQPRVHHNHSAFLVVDLTDSWN